MAESENLKAGVAAVASVSLFDKPKFLIKNLGFAIAYTKLSRSNATLVVTQH